MKLSVLVMPDLGKGVYGSQWVWTNTRTEESRSAQHPDDDDGGSCQGDQPEAAGAGDAEAVLIHAYHIGAVMCCVVSCLVVAGAWFEARNCEVVGVRARFGWGAEFHTLSVGEGRSAALRIARLRKRGGPANPATTAAVGLGPGNTDANFGYIFAVHLSMMNKYRVWT